MKDLIPGVGSRTTKKRLDELFSREVLGSVLFGAAVSKVVEKLNMALALIIVGLMFDVPVNQQTAALTLILLLSWGAEVYFFIWLYIKWEKALDAISEASDNVKDKAKDTADKAKETADKATDAVSEDSE